MQDKNTQVKLCFLYLLSIFIVLPGVGAYLTEMFWRLFRRNNCYLDNKGKDIVHFQAENCLLMVLAAILWILLPKFISLQFLRDNSWELLKLSLLALALYNWFYSVKGAIYTWRGFDYKLPNIWKVVR